MAICDANYCIIYNNIDCQGRISDGDVFRHTALFEKLENETLNLPEPELLPMKNKHIPYVYLGDNAFPLKINMMVPFSGCHDRNLPKRIFNYRLSRARRVIENVFGIMSAVFRVLRKPILLSPERATCDRVLCFIT